MQLRFVGARRQRGLSIVELLVGVAVGLFLLGGATKLFVDYLVDNRRVLVETRVTQDLRAAADLIVRDLRRAGYWADAATGMIAAGASSAPLNPFRQITATDNDGTPGNGIRLDLSPGQLTFSYDKAASSAEASGFRVRNGVVEMLLGSGGWQAVTDSEALFITLAQLDPPVEREVPLFSSCPCYVRSPGCVAADFSASGPGAYYANRPRLTLRQYTVTLEGYAPSASNIRREIRETVRVRNDQADGFCPDI